MVPIKKLDHPKKKRSKLEHKLEYILRPKLERKIWDKLGHKPRLKHTHSKLGERHWQKFSSKKKSVSWEEPIITIKEVVSENLHHLHYEEASTPQKGIIFTFYSITRHYLYLLHWKKYLYIPGCHLSTPLSLYNFSQGLGRESPFFPNLLISLRYQFYRWVHLFNQGYMRVWLQCWSCLWLNWVTTMTQNQDVKYLSFMF